MREDWMQLIDRRLAIPARIFCGHSQKVRYANMIDMERNAGAKRGALAWAAAGLKWLDCVTFRLSTIQR
jgi:hypothetical protein